MIDVLERITQQRLSRNWTEYQLAQKSGIPQPTISSWYRKNATNAPVTRKNLPCFRYDYDTMFIRTQLLGRDYI